MERKRLATDKMVTRGHDTKMAKPKKINGILKSFETDERWRALKSRPTEFIKQLIRDHAEVASEDESSLDPIKWDFAAKRLLEICNSLRDRGKVVARYNCEECKVNKKITIEVIHLDAKIYKRYSGVILQIVGGNISLKIAAQNDLATTKHQLADSSENITIIVGEMHLDIDYVTTSRVILFITDPSELHGLKVNLTNFDKTEETPLKWVDVSEEARNRITSQGPILIQSSTVEVNHEFLELLEGPQLNQLLKSNTINIGTNKSELKDQTYVPRWLSFPKYGKIDFQENATYVVYNAEESDIPKISEKVPGHLFYVEDIEDISHLPGFCRVPVTRDIDYNEAMKYLKNLSEKGQHKTPHNIRLLKFEKNWLSEVIQEDELLKLESRLAVILAPPAEGKSRILQRIFSTCPQPVCKFTSEELLQKFSPSSIDDFTVEHVHSVLINMISSTNFDRVVLERSFKDFKIAVLIDDVNLERESNLFKIIKLIVQLSNVNIVLTTQCEKTPHAFRNFDKSFLQLSVLSMTKNDKIDLITNISSTLTHLHSKVIFNHYEFKLSEMPTMIWTTVAKLYESRFGENHYNFSPQSMPLSISVAEIYDKFVELRFQSLVKLHPKGHFFRLNMLQAFKKVMSDFLPTAEVLLDITSEYCESDIVSSASSDLAEYFVDKFSFHVIIGIIRIENSEFFEEFTSFFIKRYILSSKPENHLNDMLGYNTESITVNLDIKKFDILRVLLLCKRQPNICRILFESFLAQTDQDSFSLWCNSSKQLNANICRLLRLLRWKDQENITITEILLLLSVSLGYSKLFCFIRDNNKNIVSMRDIKIRERQSFRSLLHLLMYQSRDNDPTTVNEKKTIINFLLENRKLLHTRDYFGNTPVLERNVNFDLLKYLAGRGAKLDHTDFTGKDILDKNSDNPAFTSMLMWDFPEIYDRLNLRLRSRFTPPTKKVDVRSVQLHYSVTPDLIRKFLAGAADDNSTKLTLPQIAAYIRVTLTHNRVNTDLQNVLMRDIFATSRMAFRHQDLCNILNTYLDNVEQIDFKISLNNQELMCQTDSPFFVACINGYKNMAHLVGQNFQPKWLEDLKDFELAHFFNALEKLGNPLLSLVISSLEEHGFKIPPFPVREALSSGNLNLFRIYTEKLQFIPCSWVELCRWKGFGILHHVLENSMHDSSEVLERKQELIDYIVKFHPNSVDHGDKQGRTVLLLGRAHYQLIRYLIKTTQVNIKCEDHAKNNILNVCLGNIIRYSEYLGESAYDINFCKHDQVVFLAGEVGVNDLANKQIQWIMQRTQKLVKIKEKALKVAKFKFEDKTSSTGQLITPLTVDPSLMCYADTSESEDEFSPVESRKQGTAEIVRKRRTLKRKHLSPTTSFGSMTSSDLVSGSTPKTTGNYLYNAHRPAERSKSEESTNSIVSRAILAKDNREARLQSQANAANFLIPLQNTRMATNSISSPTLSRRHSHPPRDKTVNSIKARARNIVRNMLCQEELHKRLTDTTIPPGRVCQVGYGMPSLSSSSDSKSEKLKSKQ